MIYVLFPTFRQRGCDTVVVLFRRIMIDQYQSAWKKIFIDDRQYCFQISVHDHWMYEYWNCPPLFPNLKRSWEGKVKLPKTCQGVLDFFTRSTLNFHRPRPLASSIRPGPWSDLGAMNWYRNIIMIWGYHNIVEMISSGDCRRLSIWMYHDPFSDCISWYTWTCGQT